VVDRAHVEEVAPHGVWRTEEGYVVARAGLYRHKGFYEHLSTDAILEALNECDGCHGTGLLCLSLNGWTDCPTCADLRGLF
jgi:hypothetical protein